MFKAPIKYWTSTSVRSYYNVIKSKAPKRNIRVQSPLITCKRPDLNIEQGVQTKRCSNDDSIVLCSTDWHLAEKANDYFIIHPTIGNVDETQPLDPNQFDVHPQIVKNLFNALQSPKAVQLLQHPKLSNVLNNEHTWIKALKATDTIYSFLLPIVINVLKQKSNPPDDVNANGHEFNTPKAIIITQNTSSTHRIGEICGQLLQDIDIKAHVLTNEEFESQALIHDVDIVITSVDTLQRSQLHKQSVYKWHSVQHVVLNGADELFRDEETIKGVLQPMLQLFRVNRDIS